MCVLDVVGNFYDSGTAKHNGTQESIKFVAVSFPQSTTRAAVRVSPEVHPLIGSRSVNGVDIWAELGPRELLVSAYPWLPSGGGEKSKQLRLMCIVPSQIKEQNLKECIIR